jgi:predicted RNA-binding protein with PUA-like domain
LQEIKLDPAFSDMALIRKGNRLSVMPVKKQHFDKLVTLGNK